MEINEAVERLEVIQDQANELNKKIERLLKWLEIEREKSYSKEFLEGFANIWAYDDGDNKSTGGKHGS